jgi:hypothetical protein
MINRELIATLSPCRDRFDNYIKHYGDRNFTKRQFMGLRNITHEDKLWVAFRLMPKENLRLAAADIAELVLPIYEKAYPNDNRPRKAIEAARNGDRDAARDAAYAARDAAYAAYAARDAAYAAAYAAYAARDAAYAAYAARDAAYAAAYAAYAAYASRNHDGTNLEKKIRTVILKHWK